MQNAGTYKKAVREALRKISRGGEKVNHGNLQARLLKTTGLDSIALKVGLTALKEAGEVDAARWDDFQGLPLSQMSLVLKAAPVEEYVLNWQKTVEAGDLPEETKKVLALPRVAERLKELDEVSMGHVVEGLSRLFREQRQLDSRLALFEVSAKYLLGSSKLLQALGLADLARAGFDLGRFSPAPRYLAVAGPASPDAVVLVENPHSFERAVLAGTGRCAFACTYGFGLSLDNDNAGMMLAESLCVNASTRSLHQLVREGHPPTIDRLLSHERIFFWGDLDLAGMAIYNRLRHHFPLLRLSALYEPMLKALSIGQSHPYVGCVGKKGQTTQRVNDRTAQRLADLCRDRAVDQEIVQDGFEKLGLHPLAESALEGIVSSS
jgi:hypothetical protein